MADVQDKRPVERAGWPEQRLSKVGDVIKRGEPLPANVTGFKDDDGDFAVLGEGGWACFDGEQGEDDDEPRYGVKTALGARSWAINPLTVTKVREEPAPAACPAHGEHPHGADGRVCLDCPICRPPAAEPQQADVPTLLDLVRQYGKANYECGAAEPSSDGIEADRYDEEQRTLYDRIAALVPEMPVQARDGDTGLWWQHHPCDWVRAFPVSKGPEPTWCPSCTTSGPWRPLLVGGTRDAFTVPLDDSIIALARQQQAELDKARAEVERLQPLLLAAVAWRETLDRVPLGAEDLIAATEAAMAPPREPRATLRLGRHHRDTVYCQHGDQPSDDDRRVALFVGPDAAELAAAYVTMANGGAR